MPETPKELVYCTGLGAVTVDAIARRFRQSALATVAFVLYLHAVQLFHIHIKGFTLYLTLPEYPPAGMRPIMSGFKNRFGNTLFHVEAIVIDSRNISVMHICIYSRLNSRHACFNAVISS